MLIYFVIRDRAELQARKAKALEERDMVRSVILKFTIDDQLITDKIAFSNVVASQLQAKLQLYQNADPQYHAIAHEYGSVLRSIEEKRNWLNSLDL